jgi:alanine racemase
VIGAVARIDLAAISANTERLDAAAGPAAVMAVVKADAYGHGLLPSARAALAGGARWLGVALVEEALALRAAGIQARTLTWLAAPGAPWGAAIESDVDVSVSADWALAEVVAAAEQVGRRARVHLKVDTGLGRAGATPADWPQLVAQARRAQDAGRIEVVGLWSHLAYADSPRHPTIDAQLAQFHVALDAATAAGLDPQVRHLANSAATLTRPETHFDLVRPGIAVYGVSPGAEVGTAAELGLVPAMTLRAPVALTKRVPAGQGVSYGHNYHTASETTLALVPLGYADGIPRHAGNRGPVQLAGSRYRVAGRVCMDQFVLDVGDAAVNAGDEAVVFGPGAAGEPTASDWAEAADTIAYEIVTRIGPRVRREYVGA